MAESFDPQTLAFYAKEAPKYAARREAKRSPQLDAFIKRLPAGAKVLELGCGGGQDAEIMIAAGLDVTPTDGTPELAAQARARLGRDVRVMRFDELDADAAYDGVWANACLLHVPFAGLPHILTLIWRALKPGGVLLASFKAGDGDGRDELGRFYNFPTQESLRGAYEQAGAWAELTMSTRAGGGYDGVPRDFLIFTAVKPG